MADKGENRVPEVKAENARFLKGHASWLYCSNCNKTVAYLCYVTYRYFHFSFTCNCGNKGEVTNSFGEVDLRKLPTGTLVLKPQNKRFCCEKDGNSLFSVVQKNLKDYKATVVCRECDLKFEREESFV